MRPQVFKYLKSYSSSPLDVDKLIVSAFVQINALEVKKNTFIKGYLVTNEKLKESKKLDEFILILKKEKAKFNIETLIELFEFVISPSDRIVNGAVFTPLNIRKYITNASFKSRTNPDKLKIADISCGCGGFLMTASQKLKKSTGLSYKQIFRNNIYGLDIKDYSINRTKILLSLLAISEGEDEREFTFNLFVHDALKFNWTTNLNSFSGFDIIIGNPPYVCARNLPEKTRKLLKQFEVCNSGNSDLYIPFFQLGIQNLKKHGFLGFITMNSFFKSLNGRNLREYFKKNLLSFKIVDFGTEQVFKSKNTYTCICFIENKQSNFIKYIKSSSNSLPNRAKDFGTIPYLSLNSKTGWNLNNFETISRIESTGIPFGELFKTRHGIATLKNDIYIFNPVKEDKDYYYLQNGSLYPIEKGICKDIVNTNKLSRATSIKEIKEKVIFPYDRNEKPQLLDERFIKENYPRAYYYLTNKRNLLSKRDKGKGNYENWFAFGRTQSLDKIANKLFFPKMSDRIPSFIINSDENLLFYNGQAVVGHSEQDMLFIKKLMESKIFWYYVKTTSKPYSSGYYSLNGNYIKNFGVCRLNENELKFILETENRGALDDFFERKYQIYL